jgi:hypothetical protein
MVAPKNLKKEPRPLTPREKEILAKIDDCRQQIEKYGNTAEDHQKLSKEDKAHLCADYEEFLKAIGKAIRAKLHEHPLVDEKTKTSIRELIKTFDGTGQKDDLRMMERGLETGVKRPYSIRETEILVRVSEFRRDKKTWGEILQILIGDGTIPKMSRWGFRKWIKGLDPSIR